MVGIDQVIIISAGHSSSLQISHLQVRVQIRPRYVKQSNDRPPNETTQVSCQPCCEPANACCAALDDLQLLSPQVWLTAIVRKVYHLSAMVHRNGHALLA